MNGGGVNPQPTPTPVPKPLGYRAVSGHNYVCNAQGDLAWIDTGSQQVLKQVGNKWVPTPTLPTGAVMDDALAEFSGMPESFTHAGYTFTWEQGETDGYIVTPALLEQTTQVVVELGGIYPSAEFIAAHPEVGSYDVFLAAKLDNGSYVLITDNGYAILGETDGEGSDAPMLMSPAPMTSESRFIDGGPIPSSIDIPTREIEYTVQTVLGVESLCVNGIVVGDIGQQDAVYLVVNTGFPTYDSLS